MGWGGSLLEAWMRWRDRRGPLNAIVAIAAYVYLLLWLVLVPAAEFGFHRPQPVDPTLQAIALVGFLSLVWRAVWRFGFTTATYGLAEGLRSLPRMLVGNGILIASCGVALRDYAASLRGSPVTWARPSISRQGSRMRQRDDGWNAQDAGYAVGLPRGYPQLVDHRPDRNMARHGSRSSDQSGARGARCRSVYAEDCSSCSPAARDGIGCGTRISTDDRRRDVGAKRHRCGQAADCNSPSPQRSV